MSSKTPEANFAVAASGSGAHPLRRRGDRVEVGNAEPATSASTEVDAEEDGHERDDQRKQATACGDAATGHAPPVRTSRTFPLEPRCGRPHADER